MPEMGDIAQAKIDSSIATHAALSIPHPNLDTKGMFQFIPLAGLGTVGQGTWTSTPYAVIGYHYLYNTSVADGDNISFETYLDKGTYSLNILFLRNTDKGILKIDIGPTGGVLTEVASIDTYGGALNNVSDTTTSISIATAGRKTLRLRVDGKNGSSSGYGVFTQIITLWRTA